MANGIQEVIPAVTVVIPVYNAETTLIKCLDSVVCQTFKDFECILVDDGSSDCSAMICDAYAKKDGRFIVVRQPNGGTGAARETGIRKSRGRAITFLDNDDTLEPESLECMYAQMKDEIKLVLASVKNKTPRRRGKGLIGDGTNSVVDCCPWSVLKPDENTLHYLCTCDRNKVHTMFVHGILAEKSLFEHIITPAKGGNEDTFLLFQIFIQLKWYNIAVIDTVVYNYAVDSQTSLLLKQLRQFQCGSFTESRFINSRLIFEFLENHNVDKTVMRDYMCNNYNGYLHVISVYLILNRTKPIKNEIQEFYSFYHEYKTDWHPGLYMKYTIPVFYHFPYLSRVYRLVFAFMNDIRITFRKLRRSFYDKSVKEASTHI